MIRHVLHEMGWLWLWLRLWLWLWVWLWLWLRLWLWLWLLCWWWRILLPVGFSVVASREGRPEHVLPN